ncbi:peptidase dimerization domain-containing protein, partial [Acinetobacter baumannii]|nr:peptidase dimerization domain-containing protein [Acinetobacter baumannii]
GELGELEYENFNAGSANVQVNGLSIHPGSAKNAMLNASLLAMEFHQMLPVEQNPRYTEGYEGFFHLSEMKGHVEQAELDY